jgi:hypothetical protein
MMTSLFVPQQDQSPRFAERAGERARFESFKTRWVQRFGAAAEKELSMDAVRSPPGPTWTSANPMPFRVLHMRSPPPLSPARSDR